MQIEVNNIKKTYGKTEALKGINLTIDKGMFGLLGANGAGKTTFMRILTTILQPSSGSIYADGRDIKEIRDFKNKVGYLPQEFSFYPQLTVYEVMDYLALLGGSKDSSYRRKLNSELLEKVNLLQHKKVKTRALSGGMKRRLGIAQALINDPELLIVDEPTAGLDPEERVRFRNMLSDLAADRTVILSTHIVEDIKFTCNKMAVLKEGNVIYQGKINEIVDKASGMVWEAEITPAELGEVRNKYNVISYRAEGDAFIPRILSSSKPTLQNIKEAKPTIEDSYMALMEGEIE
ncbi:MAG: ABC transporter ATP-binding protein [Bacillota bacterium]